MLPCDLDSRGSPHFLVVVRRKKNILATNPFFSHTQKPLFTIIISWYAGRRFDVLCSPASARVCVSRVLHRLQRSLIRPMNTDHRGKVSQCRMREVNESMIFFFFFIGHANAVFDATLPENEEHATSESPFRQSLIVGEHRTSVGERTRRRMTHMIECRFDNDLLRL